MGDVISLFGAQEASQEPALQPSELLAIVQLGLKSMPCNEPGAEVLVVFPSGWDGNEDVSVITPKSMTRERVVECLKKIVHGREGSKITVYSI